MLSPGAVVGTDLRGSGTRRLPVAVPVALALVPLRWAGLVSSPLDEVVQLAAAGLAAALCLYRAVGVTGRIRSAWAALGIGCAGWCAGQLLWTASGLAGHELPFPSPADAGFLLLPVGAAVAVLRFPAGPARLRARDVLDAVILVLTLFAIVRIVGLQPAEGGSVPSVLATAVALVYPLGDVVVLTLGVLAAGRARRHRRHLLTVVGAIAAVACSDGMYTWDALHGSGPGGWTSTGWLLGFGLLAVTAGTDGNRADATDACDPAAAAVRGADVLALLPYLPLAATLVVGGAGVLRDGRLDAGAAAPLLAAVFLTFVRQYLTARDNERLLSRVADQQEAIAHQAFHDPLTGLANRARFVDELQRALDAGPEDARPVGVLFCDLDDFKSVNDGLGHAAGDRLLTDVAARISAAVGRDGLPARLGGDEFAVLVRPVSGDIREASWRVASRITAAAARPLSVAGRAVKVGVSVGLAVVPVDGETRSADVVLSQADIAMYTAKRSPQRRPVAYTPGLSLPEAQDWRILPALERALTTGTLTAHYQAVVDLSDGAVRAYEALARWPDPVEGLPPDAFLPVAARNGLMRPLTEHMLGTAAGQLARWLAQRPADAVRGRMSVNVSPSDVVDPAFPALVEPLVHTLDLPPGALVLEVTEDALLTDIAAATRTAHALHDLGVLVALDDFGAGYSALAHLTDLPFDILKLDRQLVRDADRTAASRTLLRGVVALAHDLGLSVIAEGVERPSQADVLLDLGCWLAQGLLFAPALPSAQIVPYDRLSFADPPVPAA